jgi:hypothetical protein
VKYSTWLIGPLAACFLASTPCLLVSATGLWASEGPTVQRIATATGSASAPSYADQPARRPAPRSPAERYFLSLGSARPTWDSDDIRKLVGLRLAGPDASDQMLSRIPSLVSLRLLSVWPASPQAMTNRGIGHVAQLTDLEFLTIAQNQIDDAGLARLKSLKKLRGLVLEPAHVGNTGLAHLSDLCCLQTLSLNGASVDDAGLVALEGLVHLEFLSLRRTGVTEAGLPHLQGRIDEQLMAVRGPQRLKSLMLPYELQLSDEGVAALIQLLGMTNIEELNPICPRTPDMQYAIQQYRLIVDEWKRRHAFVEFEPGTDGLEIAGLYYLRDNGLTTNADVSGLPQTLKRLSLRGTEVSDEVIEEFAELSALEMLNLCDTGVPAKIGTEGLPAEPAQPSTPGTRTMPGRPYVPGKPAVPGVAPAPWRPGITDRGLDRLAELKLANLKTVVIDDDENRISAAAVQRFETATGARVVRLPLDQQPPACCPQLQPKSDSNGPGKEGRNLFARLPRGQGR